MPLSGWQHQQILQALLPAFNEAELRRLTKHELNEDLDHIAGGKNLTERVYNLIAWADAHGRVPDLVAGARSQNATNPDLIALDDLTQSWYIKPPAAAESSPYKGLGYYDSADALLFFGREKLTVEMVTHLKNHRFLAVVGASGSGKSSLVRAGVIPALRNGEIIEGSQKWEVHVVTPTARPLQALAATLTQDTESIRVQATLMDDMRTESRSIDLFASRLLARSGAPLLLIVIDQFEELFTLCKDPGEQKMYIDNLLSAASPDGAVAVILTLRADFYARCAEFANLRSVLQQYQKFIGPMLLDELRSAIENPALQNGWDFEQGLVDAILHDIEGEPGALPLLSHALQETWKRRSGRTMTFAGYHAAGGVHGAIAKTADSVYKELGHEQKNVVRSVFLRLTTLGEGVQDTRRRVPLRELMSLEERGVEAVLQKLQDARLVTTLREGGQEPVQQETFVDVTHEALIREWPQLREWLAENRESLQLHRKLTEAAEEWQRLGCDPDALYRGVQLQLVQEWEKEHASELNDLEQEFLQASVARRDTEKQTQERIAQEREAARRRELQQAQTARRRAILALAATTAAMTLAVALAWFFYQQYQATEGNRLLKEAQFLKKALNPTGAVAKLNEAVSADPSLEIDLSAEVSDTLRYAATNWVMEGELLLRTTRGITANQDGINGVSVTIQPEFLAWATETARQLSGWSSVTSTVHQQAIISATALFSQALALNPPSDTPVYVWIPPGQFTMGSDDLDTWAEPIEKPSHIVQVDGYWIQRIEVTNRQYRKCVEANECTPPNNARWNLQQFDLHPVTDIDWDQALKYAAWAGGELPTEVQWEKACRTTDGRRYAWGNESPSPNRLNMYESGFGTWLTVGSFAPGANGLFDMLGNVWEWTNSAPELYPYAPNLHDDHLTPAQERIMRGGSFSMESGSARCAARFPVVREQKFDNLGMRVAVTAVSQ
jgi:formylglycine-generating enzyme required for sulfatase activity